MAIRASFMTMDILEEMGFTWLIRAKALLPTSWSTSDKSFKLGDEEQQSSREVVDQWYKWSDVDKRNLIIKITRINRALFKCMHTNKEASIRHNEQSSHPFSGTLSTLWNACALTHTAWRTDGLTSVCSHNAMVSLGPQRYGNIGHRAGVLLWLNTGFSRRICRMAERGIALYERK